MDWLNILLMIQVPVGLLLRYVTSLEGHDQASLFAGLSLKWSLLIELDLIGKWIWNTPPAGTGIGYYATHLPVLGIVSSSLSSSSTIGFSISFCLHSLFNFGLHTYFLLYLLCTFHHSYLIDHLLHCNEYRHW